MRLAPPAAERRQHHKPAALAAALVAALAMVGPAVAQRAGWHYSPLPGEGDRAAMGCAQGSDATGFTCLAVRCEDDLTVGLHIHTSRGGGDPGRWRLDIDKESFELEAMPGSGPYGARVDGDVATLVERLRQGAIAYLEPADDEMPDRNGIPLDGSLYAINQALFYCAPPATAAEPIPAPGQATR